MIPGLTSTDCPTRCRPLQRNRYYAAELGRFVSRDPIGYGGGSLNLYDYCGSMATGRFDPSGTNAADAVRKAWGGRLPKAWGIDITGSAVVGVGAVAELQLVFFGDTCEFGLYAVWPAAARTPIEQLKVGPEAAKKVATEFFLGLPWGYDVSLTKNITVAHFFGEQRADAETWPGVFYGGSFGGSYLGKVGVGGFVGENIKTGSWVGFTAGAGLSLTPGLNFKSNPQYYHLLESVSLTAMLGETVGKCTCYALISSLP